MSDGGLKSRGRSRGRVRDEGRAGPVRPPSCTPGAGAGGKDGDDEGGRGWQAVSKKQKTK